MKYQCSAYMSAQMNNLVSGTTYKLTLDSELYDDGSGWDAPNCRFVTPCNGVYLITLNVGWVGLNTTNHRYLFIWKNGVEVLTAIPPNVKAGNWVDLLSGMLKLLSGDILTFHVLHLCGINTPDIGAWPNWTIVSISSLS